MVDFQKLWQLNTLLASSSEVPQTLQRARQWLRDLGVVAVSFFGCQPMCPIDGGDSGCTLRPSETDPSETDPSETDPSETALNPEPTLMTASLGTETTWWGLAVLWLPEAMASAWAETTELVLGLRYLGSVLVQQQEHDQLQNLLLQEREFAYEAAQVSQQQRAIARLGHHLQGVEHRRDSFKAALQTACTALELAAAEVCELLPNETVFTVRSVWGWPEDWVNRQRMARHRSLAGYTLSQGAPVVVDDLRVETRFGGAPVLHEQRVVSSISVPLSERLVLAVHSKRLRVFRDSDVEFLVAIASLTQTALERLAAQSEVNAFFDLSQDFLCITSFDGYFKRIHPRFAQMLGYDSQDLLAAPFTTWIHPEDQDATERVLAQMLQGDAIHDFINRYVHKDGTWRWLLWNALPAQSGVIYAVATDVTERQFRELALRLHAAGTELYAAMVQFCTAVMQLDVAMIHALDTDTTLAFASRVNAFEPQRYLPSLCYPVLQARQVCCLPVAETELQHLGLHHYLGQPVINAEGTVVAVITILAQRPLSPIVVEILQLFAVRTQTEMTRQAAQSRLEASVNDHTAALAKTETRLRITFDQVAIGIAELDRAGCFTASNPYFNRLLGVDSLRGTFLNDWIVGEYRSHEHSGLNTGSELCLRHREGYSIWVQLRLTPVQTANDTFTLAIAEDITARRQAETDLRLYKRAIEASSNGIILVDATQPSLPIMFTNPAFERITGYSQADVIGLNCGLLQGRDRDQPGRLALRRALKDQTAGTAEMRNYRKDGSLFWNKVTISPIFNGRGELTHYLGIQNDITALKQVEAQLQQQITQQHLLEQLTQQVRASLDLDDILQTAVQEIQLVLEADRVLVYHLNADNTGRAIAEAVAVGQSVSLNPSLTSATSADAACPLVSLSEQCLATFAQGHVYRLNNRQTEPTLLCMDAINAGVAVQAEVVVPIIQNQTLWGLIIVYQCQAPRLWHDWEVELLQALAAQMAIAIQQADLYQQVQQELAERKRAEAAIEAQLIRERALSRLAQQTRQAINAETILAAAVKDIQDLLAAERVIVFRLFEDGHSRVVEEVVEPGFLSIRDREWPDEHFSGVGLEHYWQGKPRIVQDVSTDAWADCLQDYMQEAGIYSKIAAPILQSAGEDSCDRWVNPARGVRLWGLVVVYSCGQPRHWLHSEATLVQQVADQLAIALQQTALLEQLASELQERIQAQHNLEALNDKLTLTNLELARATRQKNEFLAMMSHELRTPLNSILGLSEVLQEGVYGSLAGKQAQAVSTIYRSGQHLLELINDILSLAKIEAGKLELHPTEINVAHLCDVCLTFFRQAAQKKRIELHSELPPLPGLVIAADELRLRQALINLLSNAVKFTPSGGRVSLTVEIVPPQISFHVIDTGIGIDDTDQQKLFQAFIQLDSRLNRHYEGTGLGLALVKKIAELHYGSVSVRSQKGQGSTFSLSLPWQASPDSPSSMNPIQAIHSRSDTPLILVADDNEDNVLSLTDYLLAHGCRVVTAHDGATAVQMACSQLPDLVLMDIQMPVLDGIAAIEQIHTQQPALPILALTALTDDIHRDRALAAGARDFLTKPLRLRQLIQTIFEILPQHTRR